MEENHSFTQMRDDMPFLARLSNRYGYATHWQALAHPSEPNYLAIVGGSTFGITDNAPPRDNASSVAQSPSVFSQAGSVGKSAATYAESMPTRCAQLDSYPYVVRINPWAYFPGDRRACTQADVDTTSFVDDAQHNRLANVAFLIPNMVHNGHDGSLSAADAWLKAHLDPVLSSTDFTSGDLVVVVTADEAGRHSDNIVLTSVLSTRLSHVVTDTTLTHYSLTRFIAQILGVKPLGQGLEAPDMVSAFGF